MNKKGGELRKHMEAHGVEDMPKREGGAHLQSRSAGKDTREGVTVVRGVIHTLSKIKGSG